MIKTCKCGFNNFERLSLLTNSNNLTLFYRERRNTYQFAINRNMLMIYQLTGCCTCRSNPQTKNNIIKATLKKLKQNLTSNTITFCCLIKQITELTLKNAIGVLCLLLLCELRTVLRLLTTAIITMLSWGEVTLR